MPKEEALHREENSTINSGKQSENGRNRKEMNGIDSETGGKRNGMERDSE